MVRISKIYTRTGDDGKTGLIDGSRVLKDSPAVEVCGEVDELNSFLGLIRTALEGCPIEGLEDKIALIQNELFDIGSVLAAPAGYDKTPLFEVSDLHVKRLEGWIDEAAKDLPDLKSFVLPGGSLINSYLHIARAVCRRVERRIVGFARERNASPLLFVYFNRLSDLLFALARQCAAGEGIEEYLWQPAVKR